MTIYIYGISTCNSCKKALKWLKENNIEHSWIDLRKTPPSREQITHWVNDIGFSSMRNTSGGSYRALGDEKKSWTAEQWIEAFSADPMLLKRPLFEKDQTALFTGFRGTDEDLKKRLQL